MSWAVVCARRLMQEALDRFAQFFIAPLFTESATERELKVTDACHTGRSDGDRGDSMSNSNGHSNAYGSCSVTQAVDSEHSKNLQSDPWRQMQVRVDVAARCDSS